MRRTVAAIVLLLAMSHLAACTWANAPSADAPAGDKLPHLRVDAQKRQVRVDCESLAVDAPLEFFCVASGTNEHESVVRSPVRASHLHLAMVMIGLEPGEPVRYSEAAKKWIPPRGPPLQITMEYERDGKTVSVPAYRWMREITSKKEMPPLTWIFAGSRVMEDGKYAADTTGYLISVVNFDLTVIDIPNLASNANETLQWERRPELMPPPGTKVTMVIGPAGAPTNGAAGEEGADRPATRSSATHPTDAGSAAARPAGALSDVAVDEAMISQLRARWERAVSPHGTALREAAQTHYDVINALRTEQLRIISEADKIQRLIDELEKDYQNLTTPSPQPTSAPAGSPKDSIPSSSTP